MENTEKLPVSLKEVAALLIEKLKENQTDLTVDFQNMEVKGTGPQGTPGEWRLNGKISIKAKTQGNV